MRLAACAISVAALASIAAGCTSDDLLSGMKPGGVKLDAGTPSRPDAGMTMPPRDAEPAPDAVPDPDASEPPPPPDAGMDPPDAGPSCVCPALPASCSLPAADTPVFSKETAAMQEQLFSMIACADTYLHAAFYETTWSCVVDALEARLAQDADLVIELVIDDDQCPRINGVLDCELSRIDTNPRVTIVDDARSRYMHHKFAIADGRAVWVSSANMTRTSFCFENNNAIVVEQPEIIAGYEAEFQRMFTAREFGPTARAPIPGGPYTLYVSPETPLSSSPLWFEELVRSIQTASTSVDFMVFALTRFEVGNALMEAHGRGVRVRGLIAPEYVSDQVAQSLLGAGVPIRVAPIHSKVLIVDDRRVATGSPNWSQNSWENDEASLWIDSSTIAIQYRDELDRIYRGALPP